MKRKGRKKEEEATKDDNGLISARRKSRTFSVFRVCDVVT
jgi:hypothetical protein